MNPFSEEVSVSTATGSVPRFSEKLTDGADIFLRRYREGATSLAEQKNDPAKWFEEQANNLQKLSREQHIKQFALTYTMLIKASEDVEYRHAIAELAFHKKLIVFERGELPPDLPNDLTDICVKLMFTYGDDSKESRHKHRGLYSRDAQALRYLIASDVPPNEVEELAAKPKQGLDSWSREYKKLKNKKNSEGKIFDKTEISENNSKFSSEKNEKSTAQFLGKNISFLDSIPGHVIIIEVTKSQLENVMCAAAGAKIKIIAESKGDENGWHSIVATKIRVQNQNE